MPAAALALILGIAAPGSVDAAHADPNSMLKAMTDYLAAQTAFSFDYDASLEVVTTDHQKLMLTSSGMADVNRPDKIRARRHGGFADVEMIFDGKLLTILGKEANLYTQVEAPGTIDNLIDELRDKHHKSLPGADLLVSDPYKVLTEGVTDAKDLGSGVIGGTECDHLAFRTETVDWQIWIAQGDRPYPCRYVITSRDVDQGPQYSVQISNWKSGGDVASDDFAFKNDVGAKKVDLKDLGDIDDVPSHFSMGAAQ
jgi:hypothetical protein